jgi:hypothetical protein
VWKSEEFGPFPVKNPAYTWSSKKIQIEKIAKKSPEKKSLLLTGPRWLSNQDMNVTTVLTHSLLMKVVCLFCLSL